MKAPTSNDLSFCESLCSMSAYEYVAAGLILAGLLFFFSASVGLLRFPDCYTRMHAAGKVDTLSTILTLSGLALLAFGQHPTFGGALVALKVFGVVAFILVTSPASTHAIMQAGHRAGLRHWKRPHGKR